MARKVIKAWGVFRRGELDLVRLNRADARNMRESRLATSGYWHRYTVHPVEVHYVIKPKQRRAP